MNRVKPDKIVSVVIVNEEDQNKLVDDNHKCINKPVKTKDIDKKYNEIKWLTGC